MQLRGQNGKLRAEDQSLPFNALVRGGPDPVEWMSDTFAIVSQGV